jgi:predicted nucleotidyltransferase
MRLNTRQIETIRAAVDELAGDNAKIILFGSRVDDQARGGDIDLLIDLPYLVEQPAWLMARISGRISHRLGGQKIDVIIMAPNLKHLPIHDIAKESGIRL